MFLFCAVFYSIYSYLCLSIFRSNSSKTEKTGRKANSAVPENFEWVCQWFEKEMVPVTTSELHAKMAELANSEEIYSMKHLKRKLEERYRDTIISQTEGKPNLVCFQDARFIIEKSKTENEDANGG